MKKALLTSAIIALRDPHKTVLINQNHILVDFGEVFEELIKNYFK